jgi:hypothetical protein
VKTSLRLEIKEPLRIRRSGDTYEVVIPNDVVEQHDLREGDLVKVQLAVIDDVPPLDPEVEAIANKVIERDIEALRYLGS